MAKKPLKWSRKLSSKFLYPVQGDYEGYFVSAFASRKPSKKETLNYVKSVVNARKRKLKGVM